MGSAVGGFLGNNAVEFTTLTFLGLRDSRILSRPKLALKLALPILTLIVQSKLAEVLTNDRPGEGAKSYIRGAKVATIVSMIGHSIEFSILANRNELAIQSPKVRGVLIHPPTTPLSVSAGSFQGVARPRI